MDAEHAEYLTTSQLAARWGVRPERLRFWRTVGKGVKFICLTGKTVRYRLADVLAFEKLVERSTTKQGAGN